MKFFSHPVPSFHPVTLIQISDLHLGQSPAYIYNNINPEQHLKRCLAWLDTQVYDYLLLTGDLVNHGDLSAYERLYGYLNALSKPWQWLPGNHDDKAMMLAVCPQSVESIRVLEIGHWNVILLDTTCQPDGQGAGSISAAHIHQLHQYLITSSTNQSKHAAPKPVLLVLHHNPIPTHPLEPDPIMLGNGAEFCQLIAPFAQVKAVIFGHIHQVLDKMIDNQRFLSAPATSVQFVQQADKLIVDTTQLPGARIIRLEPNGDLHTHVVSLPREPLHG